MSRLTFQNNTFRCALDCRQCEAITAKGTQCGNRVCMTLPYCWIHTKQMYGVQVRQSTIPGAGKGLFATKQFPIGAIICPYTGELLSEDCLNLRYGNGTAPYGLTADIGIVDSACQRGPASMANENPRHSNAVFFDEEEGSIPVLKATRAISIGQEIFPSYGSEYNLDFDHKTFRTRHEDNRPC
jgi:uncharacterized protein